MKGFLIGNDFGIVLVILVIVGFLLEVKLGWKSLLIVKNIMINIGKMVIL